MGATNMIRLDLNALDGQPFGYLQISLPANNASTGTPPPLLDLREDATRDLSLEPVQLLEGTEYIFQIGLIPGHTHAITLEPAELFSPDADDWRRGRLRTRQATGILVIAVLAGTDELAKVLVEVRSRKLDYLRHYRWMLRDLADGFAELIMERFAPTEQRFSSDDQRDAATLYQRFAFLKDLIHGEAFEAAVQQIVTHRHRAWVVHEEQRSPGKGVPSSSHVQRQLGRGGRRVPWSGGHFVEGLSSLPLAMSVQITDESVDTPENRFVKFALSQWRDFAITVEDALQQEKANAPVRRGLREVQSVARRLDELLSMEMFSDVGRLTQIPVSSQVLQKKAGYRDIFRAYIQFETAAALTWTGGENVYAAGQRNVANLYEYWVYLQLVAIIGRYCDQIPDLSALVERHPTGLGIGLKRGFAQGISGRLSRLGRPLTVELWFNQRFSPLAGRAETWTRRMQPDCSLMIKPEGGYVDEAVWLHFDAKYRVEDVSAIFGDPDDDESDDATEASTTYKADDLYKMHAYRDAIRRSAGAYVIYPGSTPAEFSMYHELLPGLGAFALRPTESGGEGAGTQTLSRFIDDVLTHVASQMTQHERTRFWVREANLRANSVGSSAPVAPFLTRPPADTMVLLGLVRNAKHRQWITSQSCYNLRADPNRNGSVDITARELRAEFVLLYDSSMKELELWRVDGIPQIYSESRMLATGYQQPGGVYFCLPLLRVEAQSWLARIPPNRLGSIRRREKGFAPFGIPVLTTWQELIG